MILIKVALLLWFVALFLSLVAKGGGRVWMFRLFVGGFWLLLLGFFLKGRELAHKILETNFRKNPSSNRQKPPTKSRNIHTLPPPLAHRDRDSATNHSSSATL